MRTITIDCTGVRTEAEFWDRYVAGTGAEGAGQFGRNLDAFRDALWGGPGWPGECELQFANASDMSHAGAVQFVESLRAVAARSTHVKAPSRRPASRFPFGLERPAAVHPTRRSCAQHLWIAAPGPPAQRRATGRTVKSQHGVQFVTTPTCTRFDRPPSAQRIVYIFADGSHVNHRLNFGSISQLATYALVGGAVLCYSPASAEPAEIAERMLRAMPMDARFDSVLKRATATVLAARANLHPNVKLAFVCAMAKVAGRFDRAYFVARTAAHFRDRQSEAEQLAVFLESPMAQKHLVPLELSLESRWPAWGSVAIESADRSEWAKATSGSIEAIGQEWLNRLRESVDSDMTRDVPNELQKCGQEMLDAAKV